jgi:hypothetical protein
MGIGEDKGEHAILGLMVDEETVFTAPHRTAAKEPVNVRHYDYTVTCYYVSYCNWIGQRSRPSLVRRMSASLPAKTAAMIC